MPRFDTKGKREIRYRLKPPSKFDKRGFRRTNLTTGVDLVIGCPRSKWSTKTKRCRVGTQGQSLRFDRDYFTLAEAKRWIKKYKRSRKLR